METKKLQQNALRLLTLILFSASTYAQVGIGTLEPTESAMLDVQSTTKGMLTPRMTSTQRLAIANPVDGLTVYDTTESAFYYYKVDSWSKLDSKMRNNYKLIKSASDLSAELAFGGGTVYKLDTNTLYEINGTVSLSNSIDLNNAYMIGIDTNEDKLVKTGGGDLFSGSTGGSIKNLTLVNTGGKIFNLTGSNGDNLIIRDLVVASSNSVGVVSGYNMVFISIVQYSGNTNGVTYSNIGTLLLSNTGWFASNSGTYETYTGSFDFIEKQGGFMTIDGSAIGIDVSSNPSVDNAVLDGVSFSGASETYIEGYTSGSYEDYYFDNSWTVNCPGIKLESDEVATANIYYTGDITTGFPQSAYNTPFNLKGNSNSNQTDAVNMLRATSTQDNRITYTGKKTRTFQVNAALSVRGSVTGEFFAFFIKKNGYSGDSLIETNSVIRIDDPTDVVNVVVSGTVELAPGDYIEIWGQRVAGETSLGGLTIFSLNLNIR
ncbi:hypothetical protein ACW5R3_03390 [Bizionia sp. KMM 8389]